MSIQVKMPFEYTSNNFHEKLIEWIGDVLYDILPEHGYEVRDEQIFTAFQIADAFGDKKIHLAEAGLGTGKTFAYLLSAIPYARYTRKPVIISCASPALQEQLASEGGDIYKLSKLLNLEIDARMAKDPSQYVCDVRAGEAMEDFDEISDEVRQWIGETKKGERSEIPTATDKVWKKIAWNESMNCQVCSNRGYCKLVRAREYYRASSDLIIVDHETFFHDLWTRKDRLENNKMPILPDYSAVIFDEGHKIILPAALQAGSQLVKEDMDTMIEELENIQNARDSFYTATEELEEIVERFFNIANESITNEAKEGRLAVQISDRLLRTAQALRNSLDQLLMELQIEQELYIEAIPMGTIRAYEAQMESAMRGLMQLFKNKGTDVITWIGAEEESFYIVPRDLTKMLNETLYNKKLPIIFSSATLSNEGNFDYFSRTLGIKSPSYSTIGSPFNMKEQVTVSFARIDSSIAQDGEEEKLKKLVTALKENEGHALVLTHSLKEVRRIRKYLEGEALPFNVLYEDQGERGYLVRKFKEDKASVLVGADFWEGIDVPGEALTLLVIFELPFPHLDPLIEAQREEVQKQGLDPKEIVDYPAMGLQLKQGCGRLIRTETDKGKILFIDQVIGMPWEKVVKGALPKEATIIEE